MRGTIRAVVGFIIIMGGVGGVEASLDNATLTQSALICLVGLMVFANGVFALAQSDRRYSCAEYYRERASDRLFPWQR